MLALLNCTRVAFAADRFISEGKSRCFLVDVHHDDILIRSRLNVHNDKYSLQFTLLFLQFILFYKHNTKFYFILDTTITCFVHINNITAINIKRQTFSLDIIMNTEWHDDRLIHENITEDFTIPSK